MKFCAQRSVGVYLRQVFVCWWYPALSVGTAGGGLASESSTVDGSVTLFAGMYDGQSRCSPVLESEPDTLEPGLGPFLIAFILKISLGV